MSTQMKQEVPDGYKLTEVGVIPEDWEVKLLGELVSSVEYGSSSKSNETGTMPVLRMGNLQSGKIDWKGLVYTSDAEEIAKYRLNKNDVLFNRTNTVDLVGKTSIYKGEQPAIFAGYLIRIHRIESLLDADFLNYVLNSYYAKKYSKYILSVAVSQANINGQKLKTYPIPTPPTKAEQTLIADALSDTDELISLLEKLIAKKRAIKTAAMQQLLTGKKRLPPFDKSHTGYKQTELGEIPEDWKIVKFDSVCTIINGRGFKPYEWSQNGLPIIRIQNLNGSDDFNFYEGHFDSKILVQHGQLLFAWSGSRGTSFGPHVWHGGDAVLNYHTWKLVVDESKIDEGFFFHELKILTKIIEDSAHGASALVHTQKGEMEKFELAIPNSKEEQALISQVLSDMDLGLDKLEQRLDKVRKIKQGMMQELLTGRTRLVAGTA